MVTAVLEIDLDVADEQEARKLAEGFAMHVLSHSSVEGVTGDLKDAYLRNAKAKDLPITERYLQDPDSVEGYGVL